MGMSAKLLWTGMCKKSINVQLQFGSCMNLRPRRVGSQPDFVMDRARLGLRLLHVSAFVSAVLQQEMAEFPTESVACQCEKKICFIFSLP